MLKTILIIALASVSISANSITIHRDGIWYSNICKTGPHWAVVAYQPVGDVCYNPHTEVHGEGKIVDQRIKKIYQADVI